MNRLASLRELIGGAESLASPVAVMGSKWKQPCSEKHLHAIAPQIEQWRNIAPYLDLSQAEEEKIVGSPPLPMESQRLAMLTKWKEKLGSKATYKRLAKAFEKCKRQDLVVKIRELLTVADDSLSDEEGTLYVVSTSNKEGFIKIKKMYRDGRGKQSTHTRFHSQLAPYIVTHNHPR